jgi:hypothetical protein
MNQFAIPRNKASRISCPLAAGLALASMKHFVLLILQMANRDFCNPEHSGGGRVAQ